MGRLGDRLVQLATDQRFSIEHHRCCKTAQATLVARLCRFANKIPTSVERPTWGEQRLGDVREDAVATVRIDHIFLRSRSITEPTNVPTCAHSSTLIRQSKLKRTHARAASSSRPIELSTSGGVIDPEEHAEPCDACTPARSSAGNKFLPSTPSKHNMTVFGTLSANGVKTLIGCSWACRASRKALRFSAIEAARCGCSSIAKRIAIAFAAASDGLCVPGRRPNSWPPPCMSGRSLLSKPRPMSTPCPRKPPALCGERATTAPLVSNDCNGTRPRVCAASMTTGTSQLRATSIARSVSCRVPSSLCA